MDKDDIKILGSANAATTVSEMGITQEYTKENRDKLWDSAKGKAEYKEKVFGDNRRLKIL